VTELLATEAAAEAVPVGGALVTRLAILTSQLCVVCVFVCVCMGVCAWLRIIILLFMHTDTEMTAGGCRECLAATGCPHRKLRSVVKRN
jgi:hypothetical protein